MRKLWDYWTHILPQVNIPFERQAKQENSETADHFVTRLFQLCKNYNFGISKEEQTRNQFIDCQSHDVRKKLLADSGRLALQTARDIVGRPWCVGVKQSYLG